MSLLKLQKIAIRKIWNWTRGSQIGELTRVAISIPTIALCRLFLFVWPSNWTLQKILFCSLLGANDLNQAKTRLRWIEERNCAPEDETEIRFLYQALSNYCLANYDLEPALDAFELCVKLRPDAVWAWRVLVDFNYYLGNVDEGIRAHSLFLTARNSYAVRNGFDVNNTNYFGPYFTHSIGHTCLLADHVKLKLLEGVVGKKNVLFINPNKVANYTLLSYLFPFFEVVIFNHHSAITEDQILHLEDPFMFRLYMFGCWRCQYDDDTPRAELFAKWEAEGKGPLLKLTHDDIEYGWSQLRAMGIERQAWFVTLHVREADGGSIRNSDVCDYLPAIHEITRRGGWVFRVGDRKMRPLPPIEKVIDWAHSENWSDRVDVFLRGACRFSIETSSGPANIPELFGTKSIQSNLIPIRHCIHNSMDLVIPTLLFSKERGRLLNFREMLSPAYAHSEWSIVTNSDLQRIPNSPNEILDAVVEMFNLIDKGKHTNPTAYQIKFDLICKELGIPFRPRISDSFLKRHADLLE